MSAAHRATIPIRAKILALSLLLSLLLSAGIAADHFASVRADRKLDFLDAIILPLDKTIADARALSLSESLSIERYRHDPPLPNSSFEKLIAVAQGLNLGNCDANDIRHALDKVEEQFSHSGTRNLANLGVLHDCFEIKLRSATNLAAAAPVVSFTDDTAAIAAMASIRQGLGEIMLAHSELYRAMGAMVAKNSDPALANYLRTDVARRRSSIQRMLATTLDSVQAAARANAANARHLSAIAREFSLIVTGIAFLLALILSVLLSRQLTRPLLELLSRANLLRAGDLSVRVKSRTRDEIALLSTAFNEMADSLQRDEAARQAFGKYLDPRVVARITEEGRPDEPTYRPVAVSFCDLAGFTSISEVLPADALSRLLERYFSLMCAPVHDSGGVVDKFIGDAVMSFWATPFCEEQELCYRACKTILAQVHAMQALQAELPAVVGSRVLVRSIRARFTIAYGEAMVGSIGAEHTKGFTVIGDTVNLASRLEGIAKCMGAPAVVCSGTRARAREAFIFRELGTFRVVGRTQPEPVYELLGATGDNTPSGANAVRLSARYSEALDQMRERRFLEASDIFRSCLDIRADDPASLFMIDRCQSLATAALPPDWVFVQELESK